MGYSDRQPTVLVADDELALVELFELILVPHYTVLTATEGDTAWALLQRHRPDVALLDVQLPRRSGLALAEAIRDTPTLAGTAVLLMTGLSEGAAHDAAAASGAAGYLTKPVRLQDLLSAVEQALATPRGAVPLGGRARREGPCP
ncbi:MAG TPA: response regulator [Chloroflexota bacterium]